MVITVLLVAFSAALLLSACNNATTQGQLANILGSHASEGYVYDVKDTANNIEGTYRVSLELFEKGSDIENFGDAHLTNLQKGIFVKGVLEIGETYYETGCYYNLINGSAYMVPAYTYRLEKQNGETALKLQGVYDGTTLEYTLTQNSQTKTGELDSKSPFYDNNQIHQMLRAITTFSTSLSFGFNVPVAAADEIANMSLTAACSSTEKIKTDWTENFRIDEDGDESEANMPYKADGAECYKVVLSRATDVSGSAHTLYYTQKSVKVQGWEFSHVLVKFVEPTRGGEIIYTLKTATII